MYYKTKTDLYLDDIRIVANVQKTLTKSLIIFKHVRPF